MGPVIKVNPGKKVPQEYIEKLKLGTAVSISCLTRENGVIDATHLSTADEYKPPENFGELETMYEKQLRMYFVEYDKDVEECEEARQPYSLVDGDDNKTVIAALASGEFAKHAHDKATFPPATQFIADYLAAKINELYEEKGKDTKKVFDAIDTAEFRKEVLEHLSPRGFVCLYSVNGDVVLLQNGNADHFGKFSWGETSDKLGYAEQTETPTEPTKPLTWAEKQAAKKAAAAGGQQDIKSEPPKEAATTTPDKKPDVTILRNGIMANLTQRSITPPDGSKGSDLRKFYESHLAGGHTECKKLLGAEWKDRPPIPAQHLAKSSHLYDVFFKRQDEKSDASDVKTPLLPIPTPSQITSLIEATGRLVPETEEMLKKAVEKIPPLSVRCGKKLQDFMLAPFQWLANLDHFTLACLAREMQLKILEDNPEWKLLGKPVAAETTKAEEPSKPLTWAEKQAAKKAAAA